MHSDTFYSIGELARRTGLTVKAIRFYSDKGIVPPDGRSPAGYRLYGPDALARLGLVRTLRELGLDLATVRKVLDREATLSEVADAHADALDVQIRSLRVRRAVLRAVAQRGPTPMEMDLMHRLATLSRAEQRRLVAEFIDAVFADGEPNPEFAGLMRSVMPELPDDPSPEQVAAWAELAELCRSTEFRSAVRRVAEDQAQEPSPEAVGDLHDGLNRAMRERIEEATAIGVLPASVSAAALADSLSDLYGYAFARAGDGDLRRWLLARLHLTADPHVERYWRLLATVNGWPASPTLAPVYTWFTTALPEACAVEATS
ncbi:MerR family transcriptional regulator [Streptomyces spectabilis]|uniref:DNA-binding transcriptional MerR regulator n=1 Tax=Streptomyces spectabilis TaxID=68270 RepID=A0A5P2X1U8_STRST|nr:MerR family transcriptional regulator [Streptomyces spectabilis]MBB5107366.1 DNA-binding transcriptional MerR regulator [Streptomyces spectabilis]MCI3900056.1 MerR family transcriptional regulator [Streptomyces spectabilis]QEV57684.1 MerR family transcriptional regulator [Streptomyces spectabilis]GGV37138.1 MerR family transcriptional regulator [Streptomyces spectabilis]